MAGQQNKITYVLDFKANLTNVQQQLDTLSAKLNKVAQQRILNPRASQEILQASNAASILEMNLKKAFNANTGKLDLTKFNMEIKNSGYNLQTLSRQLLMAGKTGQEAFMQMSVAIANSQRSMIQAGSAAQALWATLKNTARWQISSFALTGLIRGITGAIGYIKDLNKSLNDIRIVSGDSADEMARYAKEANNAAKTLGSTTLDVTDATLIYRQQGNSLAESAKKAAITIKAANVATEASAEEMSSYLTAVWNSYKVGSEELELYVDKLSKVGAITAVNMSELATASEKVAATANTVGVSYDQLLATIATVGSVTRQSAETIGTAFKTIYARIGDLKLDGESVDEDGVAIKLGDVSSQLDMIGVHILDANGNMRDMGGIVEDIGGKWQTMTEAEKQAVAQVIAGKRQYTHVMALFENWDYYKDVLNETADAQGTLNDQNAIFAESWEAASNRVKDAWQKVIMTLSDDSSLIEVIDGFGKMLETIADVIDAIGGFKNIMLIIGTIAMRVFSTNIASGLSNLAHGFMSLTPLVEKYNAAILKKQQEEIDNAASTGKINAKYQEQLSLIYKLAQATNDFNAKKKNMSSTNAFIMDFDLQNLQNQVQGAVNTLNRLQELKESFKTGKIRVNMLDTSDLSLTEQQIKKINNAFKMSQGDINSFLTALEGIDDLAQDDFDNIKRQVTSFDSSIKEARNNIKAMGGDIDNFRKQVNINSGGEGFFNLRRQIKEAKIELQDMANKMNEIKSTIFNSFNVNSKLFTPIKINKDTIVDIEILNQAIRKSGESSEIYDAIEVKLKKLGMSATKAKSESHAFAEQLKNCGVTLEQYRNYLQNGNISMEQFQTMVLESDGDISKLKASFINAGGDVKTFTTYMNLLNGTMKAAGKGNIGILMNSLRELATRTDLTEKEVEELKQKLWSLDKMKPTGGIAQSITQITSAVMSLSMGLTQILQLWDTWHDDSLSASERVKQTMTQVPMIIMGVVSAYNALTAAGLAAQAACVWLFAVSAVIGGVYFAVKHIENASVSTKLEKIKERIEELNSEYEELKENMKELDNKEKNVTELLSEYEKLKEKAENYGQLSEENRNRLVEVSKELVDTYGLESSGLDSLTNSYIIGKQAIDDYLKSIQDEKMTSRKEAVGNRIEAIDKFEQQKEYVLDTNDVMQNSITDLSTDPDLWLYAMGLTDQNDAKDATIKTLSKLLPKAASDDTVTIRQAFDENGFIPEYMKEDLIDFVVDVATQWNNGNPVDESMSYNMYFRYLLNTHKQENLGWAIDAPAARSLAETWLKYFDSEQLDEKIQLQSNGLLKELVDVTRYGLVSDEGYGLIGTSLQNFIANDKSINTEDKVNEYKDKLEAFLTEAGPVLDETAEAIAQTQELINSGNAGLDTYSKQLENYKTKMVTLGAMKVKGLISQSELDAERENIYSDVGVGLSSVREQLGTVNDDFNEFQKRLISYQDELKQGTISSVSYLQKLQSELDNLDFKETFGSNTEAASEFFQTMKKQGEKVLSELTDNFQEGRISLDEFTESTGTVIDYYLELAEKVKSTGLFSDQELSGIESAISNLQQLKEELKDTKKLVDAVSMSFSKFDRSQGNVKNMITLMSNAGVEAKDLGIATINTSDDIEDALTNSEGNMTTMTQVYGALQHAALETMKNKYAAIGRNIGTIIDALAKYISSFSVKFVVTYQKIEFLGKEYSIPDGFKPEVNYGGLNISGDDRRAAAESEAGLIPKKDGTKGYTNWTPEKQWAYDIAMGNKRTQGTYKHTEFTETYLNNMGYYLGEDYWLDSKGMVYFNSDAQLTDNEVYWSSVFESTFQDVTTDPYKGIIFPTPTITDDKDDDGSGKGGGKEDKPSKKGYAEAYVKEIYDKYVREHQDNLDLIENIKNLLDEEKDGWDSVVKADKNTLESRKSLLEGRKQGLSELENLLRLAIASSGYFSGTEAEMFTQALTWFTGDLSESSVYIDKYNKLSAEEQEKLEETFGILQTYLEAIEEYSEEIPELENQVVEDSKQVNESIQGMVDDIFDDNEHKISLLQNKSLQNENINYEAIRNLAFDNLKNAEYWANYWRSMGYDDNDPIIQEFQSKWWDNYKEILDTYEKEYKQEQDKIKAIREEIEYQNNKKIEKIKEEISLRKSLIDLEKKHNDINKELRETQKEINDQLRQSKVSAQWLDKETRKLLFDQEDYYKISKKTAEIQEYLNDIYVDYQEKINNLGKYELDQAKTLTEEYEAQVEAKKEELAILKNSLNIESKRNALNTALREKNVRVFVGGRWRNVSNVENVSQAYQEYQDAVYELKESKIENSENTLIREQEAAIRQLETLQDTYQNQIDMMKDKTKELEHHWSVLNSGVNLTGVTIDTFNTSLTGLKGFIDKIVNEKEQIQSNDYNSLTTTIAQRLSKEDATNISKIVWYKGVYESGNSEDKKWASTEAQKLYSIIPEEAGELLKTMNYSQAISFWNTIEKSRGLATGRRGGSGGTFRVNELGVELLATNGGQFIELNPHEKIFNNDQMNYLYDFSRKGIASAENAISSVSSLNEELISINNLTLQLPNVTDTNSFVQGLKNLKEHIRNTKTIKR